jgi:O-antigen ligase
LGHNGQLAIHHANSYCLTQAGLIMPSSSTVSPASGKYLFRLDTFLYAMVLVLAFALPFEAIRPVITSPLFAITGLEILAGLTLLLGAGCILYSRLLTGPSRPLRRRILDPAVLPALLFLLLALISAVLAPEFQSEALKSAGRITAGLAMYLIILALFANRRRQRALIWAIILGAGASALLGLAEAAGWPPLAHALALFKIKPTEVAGLLRVSASFQYATIAAGYFEMVVPLAIAAAAAAGSRATRALALAISLLGTVMIVLTVTRAATAVLLLLLLLLLTLSWLRPACRPLRRPLLLKLAFLLAALAVQMWLSPVVRTRYTTADSAAWYGALYSVPADLTLDSGETTSFEITVRNSGQLPWDADGTNPVVLAHYWSSLNGRNLYDLPIQETPLPYDVGPGQSADLSVPVSAALPQGEYRLVWGLLHKGVEWFRYRGVPEVQSVIVVRSSGPETFSAPPLEPVEEPADISLPTLSRLSLWGAVLDMFAERPLLGHGPGNFRLIHGRYLGLAAWDTRVNANNLYLELLSGVGLLGLIAFFALMLTVIFTPITPLRRPLSGPAAPWISGLVAALLAFLLHGLFDYFLEFTSIYLLFWTLLGLLFAVRRS